MSVSEIRIKDFCRVLRTMGVMEKDVLLLHSSLKAVGPVEGRAEGIISAFLEIIGPDGILALPTHTWGTVNDQQPVYHHKLTPSMVGVLTNIFRERPDAVRSLHPTHSVAAVGNRAKEFCAGHEDTHTPCHPVNSPYGKLILWNGKVVLMGVGLTRCTFFHCLEEAAGLDKLWSVDQTPRKRWIIKEDGTVIETYEHVHINAVSDNYWRVEAALLKEGILKMEPLGKSQVMVLDAKRSADYLVPILKDDPKYFW